MRFGITILPEHRWADAEPLWRRSEELGFDHAWTYDHLTWGGLPDSPWYGTVSTLTAAAMVTERIRLGTFVTLPELPPSRDVPARPALAGGHLRRPHPVRDRHGWRPRLPHPRRRAAHAASARRPARGVHRAARPAAHRVTTSPPRARTSRPSTRARCPGRCSGRGRRSSWLPTVPARCGWPPGTAPDGSPPGRRSTPSRSGGRR